jgi:hypothetical protein
MVNNAGAALFPAGGDAFTGPLRLPAKHFFRLSDDVGDPARAGVSTCPACRQAGVARQSLRPRLTFRRGDNGSLVMQKVPSEAGEVAKRLAQVIFQVLEFLWNWSFGQILAMFRLPLNSLPLWKQMLFVLVLTALG